MRPRHTRGLMSQPGAAVRLTAVYRYIIETGREHLSGRVARLLACPPANTTTAQTAVPWTPCWRAWPTAPSVPVTVNLVACAFPHLRVAAARGDRRSVDWLSQTFTATLHTKPDHPGWLTGTDPDADVRVVLRQAIPAGGHRDSHTCLACLACLAAGRSESGQLAQILGASRTDRRDRRLLPCGTHLNDLAILAGPRGLLPLLAWQVDCLAIDLTRLPASPPSWKLGNPANWLRSFRRTANPGACAICQ
jgi:hypothetical protein